MNKLLALIASAALLAIVAIVWLLMTVFDFLWSTMLGIIAVLIVIASVFAAVYFVTRDMGKPPKTTSSGKYGLNQMKKAERKQ